MFLYNDNFNYTPPQTAEKLFVKQNRYKFLNHCISKLGFKTITPKKFNFDEIIAYVSSNVHKQGYIDALFNDPYYYAYCFGLIEYAKKPIDELINGFLTQQIAHSNATLEACNLALNNGFATNLSGGHHHALYELGEGFCLINDIAYACKKLSNVNILVVDCDAHRGNGVAGLLGGTSNVSILDIYNHENYPTGNEHKDKIDYKIEINAQTKDIAYNQQLEAMLLKAIATSKPSLILYNAGADILSNDAGGGLSISRLGLLKRDSIIASLCRDFKVALAVVLSGAYQEDNFSTIAKSLVNMNKIMAR